VETDIPIYRRKSQKGFMMFGAGILGRSKKKYTLQAYGKLPLYSDYISVLADETGNKWRAWLLKAFGRDGMRIPAGRWPYAFCPSPGASIVVGLIEDSSDGIREFPFSMFAVYPPDRHGGWYNWDRLIVIWDQLDRLRSQLATVESVDACYHLLQARSIELSGRYSGITAGQDLTKNNTNPKKEIAYLSIQYDGIWPVLLGAPCLQSYQMHLLSDDQTVPGELLSNWDRLSQENMSDLTKG
jgi:hypothetical protein